MSNEIKPEYDDLIQIDLVQTGAEFIWNEVAMTTFTDYLKATPCKDYELDVEWGIGTFDILRFPKARHTGNNTVVIRFNHEYRAYIEAAIKEAFGIEIRQPKLDSPSQG